VKIEYRDGLLFTSLVLEHKGQKATVNNIIIDTGAAQSLIDSHAIEGMDIVPEQGDVIVTMIGIGGKERALRKRIDRIQFGGFDLIDAYLDFGDLDAHPGINGLLGTDILVSGGFVIDLDMMEVHQK
jgi:hypothetical protein